MRGLRIIVGILILILSCALLIWGFLPARHEIRNQPVSPTDLQLPTPALFLIPSPQNFQSHSNVSQLSIDLFCDTV